MMTFPLAEAIIAETPLQDLVEVDETTRDLCGYIVWIPSTSKIHQALCQVGYTKITHPAVHDAIEAVAERLSILATQ